MSYTVDRSSLEAKESMSNLNINQDSQGEGKQQGPVDRNSKPGTQWGYGGIGEDEVDHDVRVFSAHKWLLREYSTNTKESISPDLWDMRLKKQSDNHNLIHIVISGLTSKKLDLAKGLDLVESTVLDEPDLFFQHIGDDENKTPLFEAAKSQILVLFRVVDLLIPGTIVEKLKDADVCKKDKTCCPLLNVVKGRLEQCEISPNLRKTDDSKRFKNSKENDKESTLDNSHKEISLAYSNGSCLHDKINIKLVLANDKRLRDILLKTLASELAVTKCLLPLLMAKNFDPNQRDSQVIPLTGFKNLLQLFDDSLFKDGPSSGYTPLQQAIKLYESPSIDYIRLHSVIRILVDRDPSSIFRKTLVGTKQETAYDILMQLSPLKSGENGDNAISRTRTEQLLKETCIGWQNMELANKKEFLYSHTKFQHQFHLNLRGESTVLDQKYIEDVTENSGIRFETVLDFVKLPYWCPEELHSMQSKDIQTVSQRQEDEQTMISERSSINGPYKLIFDWLREGQVRKIFTLEVDDNGANPHTNAAIRYCLRGSNLNNINSDFIDVQVWNWKKFDISADTVVAAAPNAQEVYLYSHGNTAVLVGWACGSSFGSLTKLRKLQVEVYPQNSDDDADCDDLEPSFVQNIKRQCPWLRENDIIFSNYHFDSGNGNAEGASSQNTNNNDNDQQAISDSVPESSEWIDRLKGFLEFIVNLDRNFEAEKKPSVKVALLDDGCRLDNLHGGTQRGISFHSDHSEFWVGSCSHGTEMARCIRDVCPMAELYIARLDDSGKYENQKFTIPSCCDALRWAIDMEVDVISMSWTFKRKYSGETQEQEFVNLIAEAESKNILLFGSLPDEKLVGDLKPFVPVGVNGVIKIGSATAFGESSKENKYAKPDFILPGEEIPSLAAGKPAKGSSFSTAYASGLAAMVLYCLKAHRKLYDLKESNTKFRALPMAKRTDGMKGIFQRLGQNPSGKADAVTFIQPYYTFKADTNLKTTERKDVLDRIVNEIAPNSSLEAVYDIKRE
ncbi:hypothetical protein HDV63DRAFT_274884 [Trichoderma sp. SZMC 28014]